MLQAETQFADFSTMHDRAGPCTNELDGIQLVSYFKYKLVAFRKHRTVQVNDVVVFDVRPETGVAEES